MSSFFVFGQFRQFDYVWSFWNLLDFQIVTLLARLRFRFRLVAWRSPDFAGFSPILMGVWRVIWSSLVSRSEDETSIKWCDSRWWISVMKIEKIHFKFNFLCAVQMQKRLSFKTACFKNLTLNVHEDHNRTPHHLLPLTWKYFVSNCAGVDFINTKPRHFKHPNGGV